MEVVRVYAPRTRLLGLFLGAVAFVAGGLWILVTQPGPIVVVAVFAIAFFGFCGFYLLSELVYRRPVLQIDAEGIIARESLWSAGRLRWRDIGTVTIHSHDGERTLVVSPHDPAEVTARAGLARRAVLRMNATVGFPPVVVPEEVLPYGLEALVAEMLRHNPDIDVSTA